MADEPSLVEPLSRNYKRLPEVERQIAGALDLEPEVLLRWAKERDESAAGFLAPEALVFFIRRAIRNEDVGTRDELFRELLERCNPHFRGEFRGFSREDREDLQGEVQKTIIENLFARDDRSDFMQVRFWLYLKRKCIDACNAALRQSKDTVSLESVGFGSDGASDGDSNFNQEFDQQLSPEYLTIISEGLKQLPHRLRRVFLLRHYVGMKIGPDEPVKAKGSEVTIATEFGRSGRTIRNWLKEADRLLAEFQEKHDEK